jgi:RNA polymerase sigma-70 factor (ECF subfamily)
VQMAGGGKAPLWGSGVFGRGEGDPAARGGERPLPDDRLRGRAARGQRPAGRDSARRDGKVISTLALDIVDGRIQTIRAVIKPNKPGTSARSRAGTPPILRCATICRVPWSTR